MSTERQPAASEISAIFRTPRRGTPAERSPNSDLPGSLEEQVRRNQGSVILVARRYPAEELRATGPYPERAAMLAQHIELLRTAIDLLPEREQVVFQHRFGLDGAQVLTLQELGRTLGRARPADRAECTRYTRAARRGPPRARVATREPHNERVNCARRTWRDRRQAARHVAP